MWANFDTSNFPVVEVTMGVGELNETSWEKFKQDWLDLYKYGEEFEVNFDTSSVGFVNPKYANQEKTIFKSPTRLECMMQDYPKLLSSQGEVGFTMYETWFCFSPAKNNIADAIKEMAAKKPSYGAGEAELNYYNWNNKMLSLVGVQVE